MRRFFFILIGALLLSSLLPGYRTPALADPPTDPELCRQRLVAEIVKVHDEQRAHVYGSRADRKGTFTVLTGGSYNKEVRGILETKGRLTSELVPPIVQSYRTLRCNLVAVCEALSDSLQLKGGTVTVRTLGCEPITIARYPECILATDPNTPSTGSLSDVSDLKSECATLVTQTLASERSALRLAVAYDSGYRAMLQFAGMMEWMLHDLPMSAVAPVRDMVNMLGRLHQIPCFVGQCDNPDTSSLGS